MNILIVGSGGREHALCWKIKQSSKVNKICCAPGNGGIAQLAECLEIKAEDIEGLVRCAQERSIDLTIVGPEVPLVAGIVDAFQKQDLTIFGPNAFAAQLEGSKIFAKEFMQRHHIPTANFEVFDTFEGATAFIENTNYPLVIKADGLAAGKGVVICQNIEEAKTALDDMMQKKKFKEAGSRIIVEECLQGQEASILVISDGKNYFPLESSQDHKRIFDDDLGPNTGGMGAYSPAPIVTDSILRQVSARIIEPTIMGMLRDNNPFKGILYVGLMITPEGPKVLEYNVRFGDPEIQAILPRLRNDLIDVMLASCKGYLDEIELDWDPRSCVCVVMSSGGYPGEYKKGFAITGLDQINDPDTIIFHAGTQKKDGHIITSGGRVLGVTALGQGLETAMDKAYAAVETIKFEHCFFRRDIGAKALKNNIQV